MSNRSGDSFKNRNVLPLLAFTGILLSVSLVNFTEVFDSNIQGQQGVLSRFVENREIVNSGGNTNVDINNTARKIEKSKEVVQDQSSGQTRVEVKREKPTQRESVKVDRVNLRTEDASKTEERLNQTIDNLVKEGRIDKPVSLETKANKDKVEFEISGTESKRFLGVFKVAIPKVLTVSAETGEVVSTRQNMWSRILSFLSF